MCSVRDLDSFRIFFPEEYSYPTHPQLGLGLVYPEGSLIVTSSNPESPSRRNLRVRMIRF